MHLFGREPAGAAAGPGRVSTTTLARTAAATVVVLMVAAQSWAGLNRWAYLSDLGVPWNDIPPEVLGLSFSSMFLLLAVLVGAAAAATVVWARSGGRDDVRLPLARFLPSAGLVAVGLVLLTVALQVGSFVQATRVQRGSYSLAADAAATVGGEPCGLTEELAVEPDPTAGLLAPATERARRAGARRIRRGARRPHAQRTGPGDGRHRAARLGRDRPHRRGRGRRGPPGHRVVRAPAHLPGGRPAARRDHQRRPPDRHERGRRVRHRRRRRGAVVASAPVPDIGGGPAARDGRLDPGAVPAQAGLVRLVARDGGTEGTLPLAVSAPRVPVTEPFADVVDPGSPALVDWPVAFVFPCQEMCVQRDGVTDVPDWRISPPPRTTPATSSCRSPSAAPTRGPAPSWTRSRCRCT